MTKSSDTDLVNSGFEPVSIEVAWCRFTWLLVAPYAALQCPRNKIGSPLCCESALFPWRTDSICLGCGGKCRWGRWWANHRKWKWEGKSDGAGARCFAIPLLMKCHDRALCCGAAGVSTLRKGAREQGLSFFVFFWPICRCVSLI